MLNAQEYLLICLAEECAEVQHRITKTLRFGIDEMEPGQDRTNMQRLMSEMTDLLAVAEMLHEHNVVPLVWFTRDGVDAKKAKVLKFMEYSRECGTLEAEAAE